MIKVYPAKATAMVVIHPTAGPLKADGFVEWPDDGFTGRMEIQDIITRDASKAWKGPPAKPVVARDLNPAETAEAEAKKKSAADAPTAAVDRAPAPAGTPSAKPTEAPPVAGR